MKKLVLLAAIVSILFISPSVYAQGAQGAYPLGFGNVALKVDYLRFMDSAAEDLGLENAIYVGLEGWVSLFMPNLYFGLESGWARSSNDTDFAFDAYDINGLIIGYDRYEVDVDVDYVPIELNAKYVFALSPCLTLDIGGGVSYNYFKVSADVDQFFVNTIAVPNAEALFFSGSRDTSDWVFGGQVFADLNYKINPCWFMGANFKYQWTDELDFNVLGRNDVNTGISADNLRVGAQVGYMF